MKTTLINNASHILFNKSLNDDLLLVYNTEIALMIGTLIWANGARIPQRPIFKSLKLIEVENRKKLCVWPLIYITSITKQQLSNESHFLKILKVVRVS